MKRNLLIILIICTTQVFAGIKRYVKQGNPTSNNGLTVATAVGITATGSLPSAFLATVVPGDTLFYIGTFTNPSYTTATPVGVPLDYPRFWHGENALRFNNFNSTAGNYITIKPYDNTMLLKGDGGNIIRAGNSNSNKEYVAIDNIPYNGINYYRLKQTMIDEKVAYSKILVTTIANETFKVYPNPVNSVASVLLPAKNIHKAVTITVVSLDGKVVISKQIASANQTETIDVRNNLANGKYIMRIIADTEVINQQIEISK
ncbi:MAG: T9SS type A sorting domain-containing protein [Chitinophagaceae bacterium]|nr:T9SS type A sorting domain-containing protein [Chitinophagaceae bacterium]